MGCWWQRGAIVMHALSSIFGPVRCRERRDARKFADRTPG
jgi:hypothetical protein